MIDQETKYIFVTGGVLSSLGKGLASAAIGALLESRGLTITMQKLDPYINVDPGTMNPFQHGEVFVTNDGAETDLDLGHYHRFTNADFGRNNNFTTGKIYHSVISKERQGKYLGRTVQVIPHITDEIKQNIRIISKDIEIVIVEIGGTIGDIESLPFLEAIRQFRDQAGKNNVIYIHLTLLPYIETAGEVKTKPTQHSVKELRSIGIQPDILMCRTDRPLTKDIKAKISMFCNLSEDAVITARDVDCIYQVPLVLHEEGLDEKIVKLLGIDSREPVLDAWKSLCHSLANPHHEVTIAIVGKYVNLTESYKSLNEALIHGGISNKCRVNLEFFDSEEISYEKCLDLMQGVDGILIPGGFGLRGIEGKISTVKFARKNKIPLFGICLGMHIIVIEFTRNVMGIPGANSTEFDPKTKYPVIYLMEKWFEERTGTLQTRNSKSDKGGTMRLGAYPCHIIRNTITHQAYDVESITERHRHRYELNNKYRKDLEKYGIIISGLSPDGDLIEIIEVKDHPWFLGCQFHPEFKSKPMEPHPLFSSFIGAALNYSRKKS